MSDLPESQQPPHQPPEGGGNPWEDTLKEINPPGKNELSIQEVDHYIQQYRDGPALDKSVRLSLDLIKKEVDFRDPILRGPTQEAQGELPTIAITGEQIEAFQALYGVTYGALFSDRLKHFMRKLRQRE